MSERRKKRARSLPEGVAKNIVFIWFKTANLYSVQNRVFHTGTIAPAEKYFCIFRVSKNVVFRVSH